MYRRQFLRLTGTWAALSALAAQSARAQSSQKMSKVAAAYRASDGSQSCGQCSLFIAPDACQVVQGQVSANGTCILFTP